MYEMSKCTKYYIFQINKKKTITNNNLSWCKINSIAIFNINWEINKVDDKRTLFKVSSPIKIPSMAHSRLEKLLTLPGYSTVLTWFTQIRWIYNCIKICIYYRLTPITALLFGSCCLYKTRYFWWCSVLIYLW